MEMKPIFLKANKQHTVVILPPKEKSSDLYQQVHNVVRKQEPEEEPYVPSGLFEKTVDKLHSENEMEFDPEYNDEPYEPPSLTDLINGGKNEI